MGFPPDPAPPLLAEPSLCCTPCICNGPQPDVIVVHAEGDPSCPVLEYNTYRFASFDDSPEYCYWRWYNGYQEYPYGELELVYDKNTGEYSMQYYHSCGVPTIVDMACVDGILVGTANEPGFDVAITFGSGPLPPYVVCSGTQPSAVFSSVAPACLENIGAFPFWYFDASSYTWAWRNLDFDPPHEIFLHYNPGTGEFTLEFNSASACSLYGCVFSVACVDGVITGTVVCFDQNGGEVTITFGSP